MQKKRLKKLNENRKNFIVGLLCSVVIFVIGVVYLMIPSFYGLATTFNVNANNLFVSGLLMIACVNLVKYIVTGKEPTAEKVYMTVAAAGSGALDILLAGFFDNQHMVLAISIMAFVLSITAVKLFTIDYYKERKDSFYYVEIMLLCIFLIVGIVVSVSLLNDSTIQIIMIGFLFIIIGILDGVNSSIKCMLKAPRFIDNIKLK